jgi:hypothetical protein
MLGTGIGQILSAAGGLSNVHVYTTSAAALSSASTSYVLVANTYTQYVKKADTYSSILLVSACISARQSVAGTQITFGVNDGNSTSDLCTFNYNTASERMQAFGSTWVFENQGGYAFSVYAKSSSALSTMTIDSNDTISLLLAEVPI